MPGGINLEGGDILTRVIKSVEIRAPPEKVWEMLALDRLPEWMDDLKSVKYTTEVHTTFLGLSPLRITSMSRSEPRQKSPLATEPANPMATTSSCLCSFPTSR